MSATATTIKTLRDTARDRFGAAQTIDIEDAIVALSRAIAAGAADARDARLVRAVLCDLVEEREGEDYLDRLLTRLGL